MKPEHLLVPGHIGVPPHKGLVPTQQGVVRGHKGLVPTHTYLYKDKDKEMIHTILRRVVLFRKRAWRTAALIIAITLLLLALPGRQAHTAPADGTLTLEPCALVNGQFDDGLSGWSLDGGTSTEDPTTGHPAPARRLSGWSYTSLSQPLRLVPGNQTTVSIWARSASTGTLIIDRVWLDVYDEHPATWPPVHSAVWPVTLDAEWHQYSTTFTPGDAVTHTLTLRIETLGDKDDPAPDDVYLLWFDAVEVSCGQLPYSYYLPLLVK